MMTRLLLVLLVLFGAQQYTHATRIKRGFQALEVKDYFKAKKMFGRGIKYKPAEGALGLSIIFSRDDNPFYNLDSAYAYILQSENAYQSLPEKKQLKCRPYIWGVTTIDSMKQIISTSFYKLAKNENSLEGYTRFIKDHPWASQWQAVVNTRDSIAFFNAMTENTSEAYKEFIDTYPGSMYMTMAEQNYYNSDYYEQTADGTLDSFLKFLEENPNSPMKEEAELEVYKLVTAPNTVDAYQLYVLGYGHFHNVDEVWKEFYQIYLSDYSKKRMELFIERYGYSPIVEKVELDIAWCDVMLFPFVSDKKYGYMNRDGKEVIAPTYDFAGPFNDGLAQVVINGKAGFIDKLGKVQIPIEYDGVGEFHEGRCTVEKAEKIGLIDRNNRLLLPCIYEDIGVVSNGLVYVSDGDHYGYATLNGELIIPQVYEEAYDFVNGVAKVESDGLLGLINTTGQVVIPFEYEDLTALSDTLLICEKDGVKGVITNNGTVVIEPKYDQIGAFKNGLALVARTDTVEYINIEGEVVISKNFKTFPNFLMKGEFYQGTAVVYRKGKYGKINNFGRIITDIEYENLGIGGDYSPFQKKGMWGLLSSTNKITMPANYESIDLVDERYVVASMDDTMGVMDLGGNILIPFAFNNVEYIKDGIFIVSNGSGYELYSGKERVSDVVFDQISAYDDDFVFLVKGEELMYYDINRKKLIQMVEKNG